MNRRTVASWCFYDFGNSTFAVIFVTIYATFYSQGVVEGDDGATWWAVLVSLSMGIVAVSAPFMGGIADHAGVRKRMLAIYTLVGIVATAAFSTVVPGAVWLGLALGVTANVAFEGGIVFYNSYLPDIVPPNRQGRISGYGFAVGYAGSLLALFVGAWLAKDDRINAIWFMVAALWALGAIPALLFLPPDTKTGMGVLQAARTGFRQTVQTWREVAGMKNLRRFLVGYFFYMDGVNTVITFAALYAAQELGFGAAESLALFGMVQLTALVGSFLMAAPSDRHGPHWAVVRTIIWWMFVVIVTIATGAESFEFRKQAFWFVAGLAGLGLGSIQACSRALMARLVPDGREAEFFGLYALCGKAGAIMGPLMLTGLGWLLGPLRLGLIAVPVLYAIGLWMLLKVRVPELQSGDTQSGAQQSGATIEES